MFEVVLAPLYSILVPCLIHLCLPRVRRGGCCGSTVLGDIMSYGASAETKLLTNCRETFTLELGDFTVSSTFPGIIESFTETMTSSPA